MTIEQLLEDDLYYIALVIVVCANSFGLGLVIGWIITI